MEAISVMLANDLLGLNISVNILLANIELIRKELNDRRLICSIV